MKLNHFLSVKAIISLLFGVIIAAVPVAFMSVFGVDLDPVGSMMARLLGAMLVAVGLICWTERNREQNRLKGITFALFVGDGIGFVIILVAQLADMFNALGWANVALWLFLAMGLGYYRFVGSDDKAKTSKTDSLQSNRWRSFSRYWAR